MKIIYYGKPFFADCDFPLVKALQDKGVDVHYYMPLPLNFLHSSILEFDKPVRKMGLVKASKIREMDIYKNCIDLNRLYFIKGFPRFKFWIPSWCLWIFVLCHMKRQKADVIHVDWQFDNCFERFIFKFWRKTLKFMTVHDPIIHSGLPNANVIEKQRKDTFKWANCFMLLSEAHAKKFLTKYGLNSKHIFFSRLGNYTSIFVHRASSSIESNYILFFGQITPHKGIEFLLEAMLRVHKLCPTLKLVIAGRGNLYFDIDKYKNLDYIEIRNHYIGISELVKLVSSSLFVICPYKDATQSGVVQTALTLEKPVIASNVGNMAQVVKDGRVGMIVPPCDVESLENAIVKLVKDEPLRKFYISNIRKQNEEDNRWDLIAEDYIHAYVSQLSKIKA